MYSTAPPTMRTLNNASTFCLPSQLKQSNSGRRPFTVEEDAKLLDIMTKVQFVSWEQVAASLGGRSSRQVRERWVNYLNPSIRTDPWNDSEDLLLLEKVNELGRCWSNIGKFFNGRSENDVKNRWYSHLRYNAIQDDEGKYHFVADQSQSLYPDRKKRNRVKISPQQNALRVLEQQRNKQQQAQQIQIQQQFCQFQQFQMQTQPQPQPQPPQPLQFNMQMCFPQQQFHQTPQMMCPQVGVPLPQISLVQPQNSMPQISPHVQPQNHSQKESQNHSQKEQNQLQKKSQQLDEQEPAKQTDDFVPEEFTINFTDETSAQILTGDVDDIPEPEYVDFWDPHLFDEASTEASLLQFPFTGLSLY